VIGASREALAKLRIFGISFWEEWLSFCIIWIILNNLLSLDDIFSLAASSLTYGTFYAFFKCIIISTGRSFSMSTLTPKELSALLSKASEMTQEDDLEVMIARLDDKWRELKRLLRTQEHVIPEERPDFQAGRGEFIPAEEVTQGGIPAQETNTGSQRPEKLDEEAEIREHLARIEKQNFNLTIYAIVCTVLILFMVFSSYFLEASHASAQNSSDQPAQPQLATTMGIITPGPNTVSPPQTPALPTSEVSDSQKLHTGMNSPQEPAIPQVEYVGSRISNKYHNRSCKWAKDIITKKLLVFHSVAEAQKAGYI
jgi:hypothetical protein